MYNVNETLELINNLIGDDNALPGLDFDTVVDNFVEVKYKSTLDQVSSKEERDALLDKWTKYYKEGEGKLTIQMEISTIKSNYSAVQDQLKYATEAIASTTASNAIPPVITVGSATSSPNPAYYLIENKTKVNQISSIIKGAEANMVNLLKSSAQIAFQVPSQITQLINTLAQVKEKLNSIPIP